MSTPSPHPQTVDFVSRHIGPRDHDIDTMVSALGFGSLEELVSQAVPADIRSERELDIEAAPSEGAVTAELRELGARNTVVTSMVGLGYYNTATPPVVRRNLLKNPAWYTSYTPYQAEISQGRLEALLNFQTMCSDMTGLETSGASLLDEPTAAAEAMTVMRRASKVAKDAVLLVDEHLFPQTHAVLRGRAHPVGIDIVRTDVAAITDEVDLSHATKGRPVFGVIVQYPGGDGRIRDFRRVTQVAHDAGALVAAAADLLALTLLTPPGEWGADIAVGSAQRFGVPMGFGGPHAGYMSVRRGLERMLPGRLVGVSKDADGSTAYRLALQTREQHIRREKATSNICTAQVLLAVISSMYAVWHGPEGIRANALRAYTHAHVLAHELRAGGYGVSNDDFFDTIRVTATGRARRIVQRAEGRGVNLWCADENTVLVSADETTIDEHLALVCDAFGVPAPPAGVPSAEETDWAEEHQRTSAYLTHPVFHRYRSETSMLRYMRRLADKDFALDRGMIPLGSCTMKLNGTTEMETITWPEFGAIHPFAPANQSMGYHELIDQLSTWLCEVTGYDRVSLQPNAGSQGEFAGLLAIRGYHVARGQEQRRICLIPESAHGTNAASAVMAGMKVVVIKTLDSGDIDLKDLDTKIAEHGDELAAIMITYPSTYGVFESTVSELCARVHDAGGQVYVDGANLNALMGLAKPGHFGGDVSHLNLHKTFCIPHGGGGPGVGPVGVRAHLAPHLPNHPLDSTAGPDHGVGAIAGAPFGSAGILPISWAYVRLMGGAGLTKSAKVAVLSANYIAHRLREHYPILYSGEGGLVAHECILDLRQLTKDTGVTVDDVAKRLIDYGFHAPTMSFPVGGTLMVEPTESEDLAEVDRFCDAMIAIRAEIDEATQDDVASSVLRGAPHTAQCLTGEWPYDYERAKAVYPAGVDPESKYWPPVRRVDGAWGDRNLQCSCPPIEELAE